MTDILIVEDDKELGPLLRGFITVAGFTSELVEDAETASELMAQESYRLALVDIMLPGKSGYDLCTEIRRAGNMPILLMSARADEGSMLLGYETGADDFIEKPFSTSVLIAKLKAMLKRSGDNASDVSLSAGAGESDTQPVAYRDLVLDPSARTVTKKGVALKLNVKEFELLEFFMKHQGEAIDKNTIFDNVWGRDCYTELGTVLVHIKWLREKIEDDPKDPKYIQTVYKVGYRFGEAR